MKRLLLLFLALSFATTACYDPNKPPPCRPGSVDYPQCYDPTQPKMGASLLYPGRVTQQQLATQPQLLGSVYLGASVIAISPTIDAFAAPGTLTPIIPTIGTGLRFVTTAQRQLVVTRTGTVTGTHVGKIGTNGAHDNASPSVTSTANAAQVSLANPGDVMQLSGSALTGTTAVLGAPEATTPVIYEITTSATGAGATYTFKFVSQGFVAAFP